MPFPESLHWGMAPLCRFEPFENELLEIEPEETELFEKISIGSFFRCFNGHHIEVTRHFTLSVKDDVSQIGDLWPILIEGLIAKATKLLQKGEC